jgi:ribonuclease HI
MKYWVDGGCRNQGKANRITWEGYGSFSDGERVTHFELPDAGTNNEAEYQSLLQLLKTLSARCKATIYTDSRLMVGQLTDDWKVKAERLKPLVEQALAELKRTGAHLQWVPRKEIVKQLGH